jgi:hypothetical protein
VHLYHVKGTSALNTYAVEVPAVAASLNSGDCFILVAPHATYAWGGNGESATHTDTSTSPPADGH